MVGTFSISTDSTRKFTLIVAWGTTLFVSFLPDILFRELTGSLPSWLYWSKVGLVAALLLVSMLWKNLRRLWMYFAVLTSVLLFQWGVNGFYDWVDYEVWFADSSPFLKEMYAVQIPRATTGVLLVFVSLMLMRRRERFFFVAGQLSAEAEPIPFILTKPPAWYILGPAIALALSSGLGVFVFVFGSIPSVQAIQNAFPLLPFVILFAASNAFGEEMIYRAPWLGALEVPVGSAQALLMTAVWFGIAHYSGVPYGILGVVLAFIPGWLMGKAMLETRGFFWSWFIHICMDIVIFFSIALGSVTAGG